MELKDFELAMKNIPIAGKKEYQIQLLHSVNVFIKNAKWRACFALNLNENENRKNTYGFNSTRAPPFIEELVELQKKLIEMVRNVKYVDTIRNELQDRLRKETKEIKKDSKLFVPADKTSNHYKVEAESFEDLLSREIHKDYRKSNEAKASEIEEEAKMIAHKLDLADRIFRTSKREANITLKDTKPNFREAPSCRLINPTKTEIGKVSKQILSKLVAKVKASTKYNQWKNTDAVIRWFSEQPDKQKLHFLVADIKAFYPNISETLLKNSLNWASSHTVVTEDERKIILHARRSLLYFRGSPWVKKENADFDVGMGSFDGAECCDIVGLFLLSQLQDLGLNVGLYRDDLLATSRLTRRQNELVKQKLTRVFAANGLEIPGAEANKKSVDFLDVTLDIPSESYKPFIKPGSVPKYIHRDSDHPPSVIRAIPRGVNDRLSRLSSSEAIFNRAAPLYQEALKKAGYSHQLTYNPPTQETRAPSRRCRKRRITWFNPPFSKQVKTNIASTFLNIIDECFPAGHVLRSSFNRNTIKASYRTMANMAQTVAKHNKKVLSTIRPKVEVNEGCNCRSPPCPLPACLPTCPTPCPRDGHCLTPGVIYQAEVTATEVQPPPALPITTKETYTGLSKPPFKSRLGGHKHDMRHETAKGTTLSKHVWDLKREGTPFTISWSILARGDGYNPSTKSCRLCLLEKWHILFKPEGATLNKRLEVFSNCRHKASLVLDPSSVEPD